MIGEATNESFDDEVLASPMPVLVDFWAQWCGPCRLVAPFLDEIAKAYRGRAKVVRVNTDLNRELASRLGVRSMPTVLVVSGGRVTDTIVGVRPKEEYVMLLERAFAPLG